MLTFASTQVHINQEKPMAAERNDIILDNLVVTKQPSSETCWASVVSAVGNRNKKEGEHKLSPLSLIVAEHIQPSNKEVRESQEFANAQAEQLARGTRYDVDKGFAARTDEYNEKQAANPKSLKKRPLPKIEDETRSAQLMLKKHFQIEVVQTPINGVVDTARTLIRDALRLGKPVMLAITSTAPLKFIEGSGQVVGTEKPFKHVVLCYGASNLDTDDFTVRYRDPAKDNQSNEKDVALSELVAGYTYRKPDDEGENFKKNFGAISVTMKLTDVTI
ncbi:MAG: hypothetical protein WKG03_04880 [Telluria sp.]